MKKGLVIITLMAMVVSTQAIVFYWGSNLLGGDGVTWAAGSENNFFDTSTGTGSLVLPGAADHVIIENDLGGNPINLFPTISSNVGTVDILTPAWDAGENGTLTVIAGGTVVAGSFMRLGNGVDSVGTLNMDGGLVVANLLHVGRNSVAENQGGSGIVNLSGTALMHAGALEFSQEHADYLPATDQDGTGIIYMSDSATFLYNGNRLDLGDGGDGRALDLVSNGMIVAANVGDSIVYSYDIVNARTVFTVIPEPATMGLFVLIGGGMLWVRKRFVI